MTDFPSTPGAPDSIEFTVYVTDDLNVATTVVSLGSGNERRFGTAGTAIVVVLTPSDSSCSFGSHSVSGEW